MEPADPLALPRLIERAGRALYGDDWQSPLARALGMNLRTVQRIASAAHEGQAYPVATGVLADLYRIMGERQLEVIEVRELVLKATRRA